MAITGNTAPARVSKRVGGLKWGCSMSEDPSPRDHVTRKDDEGDEEGVPDPAGAKTGQIDEGIGGAVGGIDQIDQEGPFLDLQEAIPDQGMEKRGQCFRDEPGRAVQLGTKKRQQVIGISCDQEGIVPSTDQEEKSEEPDIVSLCPGDASAASKIRTAPGRPEGGVVALKGPPGKGQQHKEKDFSGSTGDSPERQAQKDQEDGAQAVEESCSISSANELSQSGKQG